ncbi:MAG: ATP-binding cassette domain-containing protein [Chloroflexota bacterium]|nr:ATP-binding cassette domain-containing protein [Chloroflexota bacterium]
MSVIQVRELSKHFKVPARKEGRFAAARNLFSLEHTEKVAVDRITFAIEKGEMVGYVGPNGAGKSTTIKMLTGILLPTSGEVEVDGLVPHRDRKRLAYRIGVVFGQKTQLWWDVPVIESLRLLKEIYKIPTSTYEANLALFNDMLDLHEFQDTPVRQLSLGQRMRSDLVAALLHNPDILFLDEPTIGVDVVAKDRFRTFLQQLNEEQQVTVLLTTHDLSDIEKVCERMMIIDEGCIIYDGAIADMKEQIMPYRVLVVDFADNVPHIEIDQAELMERKGWRSRFRFDRRQVSASELITALAQKYPVKDISIEEPEIETIVREIYERSAIGERLKGQ